MDKDDAKITPSEEIERLLERKAKNKCWLLWFFFLCSSPGILNSMHLTVSVFFTQIPPHWCSVPELEEVDWTQDQIRIVSSPLGFNSSCQVYNWNYTYFAEIGYNSSLEYIDGVETKPNLIKCNRHVFEEPTPNATPISEWDLVCEREEVKSWVQLSVALGKLGGALFFGVIADRIGRKKCIILASILYILTGPTAALTSSFTVFLVMRILIGVAGSGAYECGCTVLTEMTVKNHRTWLGCMYNISYSIGLLILPCIAYLTTTWRQLQYALSIPALALLIHCWCIPESPRWLITQGREEEAFAILRGDTSSEKDSEQVERLKNNPNKDTEIKEEKHEDNWMMKVFVGMKMFFKMFSTGELRKRIIISYLIWYVSTLSYMVMSLNAHNFTSDVHTYLFLNGLAEAPGNILPLIIMIYVGRKATLSSLYFLSGFALIIVIVIPQGSMAMMITLMIGRFSIGAVYAAMLLYTSELFPTTYRNTAIGTSFTMGQLGTISASYVVDILGKDIWYIPSTLCGLLSIVCGLSILLLPETKNKPMPDTIQDLKRAPKEEKVSFVNCCRFK